MQVIVDLHNLELNERSLLRPFQWLVIFADTKKEDLKMAKLKSVRLKQTEIQVILSKLKHSKKNDPLIAKLWQASNMSGEKIDDIEFDRLQLRNNKSI